MTLLALVRHGQTDWNRERRIQGRTDIPLNDTGRAQALLAAEALRDGGWERIAASPLGRALETAQIISGQIGLDEPTTHPGLMERDYGIGEGTLVADYLDRFAHGEVPGGETYDDVADRATAALDEIVAAGGERIVVVAHGGVIRALLGRATDGDLPRPGERIENASVTVLRHRDGTLEVETETANPADAARA